MTCDAADRTALDPVQDVERTRQAWLRRGGAGWSVEDLMRHLRTAIPFYQGLSCRTLA